MIKLTELRSVANVVSTLRPISKALRRSFERACNGFATPRQEKVNMTKQHRLIDKAKVLAEAIGFNIYVQGDPRGCALYLVDDSCNNDSTYNQGVAIE